jgi:hypothetical protein
MFMCVCMYEAASMCGGLMSWKSHLDCRRKVKRNIMQPSVQKEEYAKNRCARRPDGYDRCVICNVRDRCTQHDASPYKERSLWRTSRININIVQSHMLPRHETGQESD